VFEHAVTADNSVSTQPAIEFRVGHPCKTLHKSISIAKFRPEPGIRRKHSIEWIDPATTILIHNIERYSDRLIFAFHYNAIAKFGVIRDLQFRIVDENTVIIDDIV